MIRHVKTDKAEILVLAGRYGKEQGVKPRHIPASIFDIRLSKGETMEIETKPDETVFVFLMEGGAVINGQIIPPKTAVLFGKGDYVEVSAQPDTDLRWIFFSGKALHEPIAWGGPIVMNTREELEHAFDELNQGTFIKHG
jgi:quercetin 2,3-dioxygenase